MFGQCLEQSPLEIGRLGVLGHDQLTRRFTHHPRGQRVGLKRATTAGFAAGHLELVTEAVARFAAVTALRAPLVSAGAVAPLVKLVRSSHAGRRLHASQALAHLAESSADARAAISALGCVAPLLELSNRGALACRRALLSLMAEPTARAEIEAAGGVPRAESEGVWV